MKARVFLLFVGLIGLYAVSCKKDIKPIVHIFVEDTTGTRLENARVYTHPCFDGVSCDTSRINLNFIKSDLTDGSGQITFEFPYSAILDVFANYVGPDCDTAGEGPYCIYEGRTVARFETKRAKGNEENEYNVKVIVRKN